MKLNGLGFDVNTVYLTIGKSFPYQPSAKEMEQAGIVIGLYNTILGRDPMPIAGQPDVWYDQLRRGVITPDGIAKVFGTSAEFLAKHGGQPATTTQTHQIVSEVQGQIAQAQPKKDGSLLYVGGAVLAGVLLFGRKLFKKR